MMMSENGTISRPDHTHEPTHSYTQSSTQPQVPGLFPPPEQIIFNTAKKCSYSKQQGGYPSCIRWLTNQNYHLWDESLGMHSIVPPAAIAITTRNNTSSINTSINILAHAITPIVGLIQLRQPHPPYIFCSDLAGKK